MLEIYTIYGGEMWKYAFDAVVGILGNRTWITLLRLAGTFAVLGILFSFIKTRNPMMFVQWLAIFVLITSVLLVPKRSVQIIDITDPAAVWTTDNVPVGLAAIASLTTSIGFKVAQLYDMMFSRPDSVTYTKSGMLFGSQIVAETSDIRTQNPELAQMLPDYVENCVIGDILLNHKYTVNQLLNTTDPLGLITTDPSPLRGIYKTSSDAREFLTCAQAATQIKTLANTDSLTNSVTFSWLTSRIFGSKVNGASLLANAMGESYGYFYSGGLTAAQVMKNNVTNSAIRQGIRGFAARSSDTANLLNLATESASTKQRLSWAAGSVMATRTLPFAQSLLMLILVCLFPLVIALAASNHSLFGLNTLKLYVCGFLYFQMWPVMFAILNYAATFWLQSKTGGTALVLSNTDAVALQHSDVANLAGYLSLSIPLLSFYLTKGAASMGSQVAGSVFSSMAFGSAGVASTSADGNWSFNNMSMDNLNQNKMDTNFMQRQGQQTWQGSNGSTLTQTSSGQSVIDGSGAMSNLPVNMKLSQLASSGFQEQARQSQVEAQTALSGYNHSVTSGWNQLSQAASQTGSSDSLSKSSDNSETTNISQGTSMMMSAVESYAKSNNISSQEAYSTLMNKSRELSVNAGASGKFSSADQVGGKAFALTTGLSAEAHAGIEGKGATGSSHGTQNTDSSSVDNRHDRNSQLVNDFRQGLDKVTSSRVTDSGNHTDNASTSNLQQFAATMSDAKSQYQQYTDSSTRSAEASRMATLAQNQSASLDTNYTQEFVNWSTARYGDKAQDLLTNAPTAREAAVEFVKERLEPEIAGDYRQGQRDVANGGHHDAFTPPPVSRQSVYGGEGNPVSQSSASQDSEAYRAGSPSGTTGDAHHGQQPGYSSPAGEQHTGTYDAPQNYGSRGTLPGHTPSGDAQGTGTQDGVHNYDGRNQRPGHAQPGSEQHAGTYEGQQNYDNRRMLPGHNSSGGAQRTGTQDGVHNYDGRNQRPGHAQPGSEQHAGTYEGQQNHDSRGMLPGHTPSGDAQHTGTQDGVHNYDGRNQRPGHAQSGSEQHAGTYEGQQNHDNRSMLPGHNSSGGAQRTGTQDGVHNYDERSQHPGTGETTQNHTSRSPQPGHSQTGSERHAGTSEGQQNYDNRSSQPGNNQPGDVQHRGGMHEESTAPERRVPNTQPGSQSMRDDFRQNQAVLPTPINNTLPGQTALAEQVAEQRSANERNINKSSGEIDKKQSTVQTSSDILIGETDNAHGKFKHGYANERAAQGKGDSKAEEDEMEKKILELRNRRAG